jgi:hypothetical protein
MSALVNKLRALLSAAPSDCTTENARAAKFNATSLLAGKTQLVYAALPLKLSLQFVGDAS